VSVIPEDRESTNSNTLKSWWKTRPWARSRAGGAPDVGRPVARRSA
jgi:hypothetical protein